MNQRSKMVLPKDKAILIKRDIVTIQSWVSGRTNIPHNLTYFHQYVPIQEHFKRLK